MQHSFQEIARNEIEKLSVLMKNEGFSVTNPDKKMYSYEVNVNSGKDQIKLLVYFGKKGIKKVLQGNEETNLFRKLKKIVFGNDLFDELEKQDINFEKYIGTDESGKGDYFGPLVVAAVYVDRNSESQLAKLGVKDSKLLSDNFIIELENKIKKTIDNNYDIVVINPEKYNKLYESFGNLNKLLGWAHAKAMENLAPKTNCVNVISDKFGNEQIIKNELSKKKIELNLYQTPKAERYIAVAAASILARAKVIQWFEERNKELGVKLLKGASKEVNQIAISVLKQNGKENLRKLIKFHFKNSKEIF
ncbi:MAG TPA: ribonuclease HIII [Ignavibacteriaceae bacterium]|nr:ribonuclease HIII [Ignavibacteriaceae bacterium]